MQFCSIYFFPMLISLTHIFLVSLDSLEMKHEYVTLVMAMVLVAVDDD